MQIVGFHLRLDETFVRFEVLEAVNVLVVVFGTGGTFTLCLFLFYFFSFLAMLCFFLFREENRFIFQGRSLGSFIFI
jgi:hypothetical protein